MKLRLLSILLDTVITLLRLLDVLYLYLWHARAQALPRRAGDGEKTVKSVNEDWRESLLQ